MPHRWLFLGLGLVLGGACRCQEQVVLPPIRHAPPLPHGGSVFFVGNSFFAWDGHNLPEWVKALGAADGVALEVGSDIVPGDRRLGEFLSDPTVVAALASRRYQVWVLQAHELEPVDHPAEFERAIRDFDRAIRAAGGRTVLFMTWEFPWRRFLPELIRAYESIGQSLALPIIPAGEIYGDLEQTPPPGLPPFFLIADRDHPEGELHENELGTAVNTFATYGILTGRDPRGLNFTTQGATITPALMGLLSERAWARVTERLPRPAGAPL